MVAWHVYAKTPRFEVQRFPAPPLLLEQGKRAEHELPGFIARARDREPEIGKQKADFPVGRKREAHWQPDWPRGLGAGDRGA